MMLEKDLGPRLARGERRSGHDTPSRALACQKTPLYKESTQETKNGRARQRVTQSQVERAETELIDIGEQARLSARRASASWLRLPAGLLLIWRSPGGLAFIDVRFFPVPSSIIA